jgi:peptidoglycan/LPS O-acetylase OafA/YrhL
MNSLANNTISQQALLYQRLQVLDGFRGMAIMLVVMYHYLPSFHFGWVGVDLFFLLSGFLITGKLLESIHQNGYLKQFYWHRVRRIVPLYFFVLLLFLIILPLLFPGQITTSTHQLIEQQWNYWFFVVNIKNAIHGWPDNITLIHFWSLACEMQFYFLWPLIVLILFRKNKIAIIVLLLIILGALIFRLTGYYFYSYHYIYRYVLLPSRIDAFAVGALLYWFKESNKEHFAKYLLSASAIALIAAFIWLFFTRLQWHFVVLQVAIYGLSVNTLFWAGIFFYALTRGKSFISRLCTAKPFQLLGKYSYGLYVWHLPVLVAMPRIFKWIAIQPAAWLITISALLVTFFCSYSSYHLLEKRFLKLELFR